MERPSDISRPFFAYGIFKPGQLGYFQIREFVDHIQPDVKIHGVLRIRDGLPIIDPGGNDVVSGTVLTFRANCGCAGAAYDRIAEMEPDKQYRWDVAPIPGAEANVLMGKSPEKGSTYFEDREWDGWRDPLFTDALEVIDEELNSQRGHESGLMTHLRPLFRLQMAYLLLWSAIERYASLRYSLGDKVLQKVERVAGEPAFAKAVASAVETRRKVYRADRPERVDLDPAKPERALKYYYQVRSNITHRGKAVFDDYKLVQSSLAELLGIFRAVLRAAEIDAACHVEERIA